MRVPPSMQSGLHYRKDKENAAPNYWASEVLQKFRSIPSSVKTTPFCKHEAHMAATGQVLFADDDPRSAEYANTPGYAANRSNQDDLL